MQVLCPCGPRIWQMQKFVCYCTVFALFYFEFEDNFLVHAPGGMYLEGQLILSDIFLHYEFGGPILEGFINGVAYFQNFTVFHICKCTLAYLSRDQIYRHLYRQKLILILIHVQALLYLVQCILSQRHQLISTIPTTVPLL